MKKMPIGTVSKGRKKVAEGDWREVKNGASKTSAKNPLPKPTTKMVVAKTDSEKYVIWGVAPGKDYEDLLVSERVEVTTANMGQMKKKLESMGVTKIRFSKLEPLTDSTLVGDAFKGAVRPMKETKTKKTTMILKTDADFINAGYKKNEEGVWMKSLDAKKQQKSQDRYFRDRAKG